MESSKRSVFAVKAHTSTCNIKSRKETNGDEKAVDERERESIINIWRATHAQ